VGAGRPPRPTSPTDLGGRDRLVDVQHRRLRQRDRRQRPTTPRRSSSADSMPTDRGGTASAQARLCPRSGGRARSRARARHPTRFASRSPAASTTAPASTARGARSPSATSMPWCSSATTSTRSARARSACDGSCPQSRSPSMTTQALSPLPLRPRPAGSTRRPPVDGRVGRPRGVQRPRRRTARRRPGPSRGRASGLVRIPPRLADRRHADLPVVPLGQARRAGHDRHPAVPLRAPSAPRSARCSTPPISTRTAPSTRDAAAVAVRHAAARNTTACDGSSWATR
jgi:hypothetical protein